MGGGSGTTITPPDDWKWTYPPPGTIGGISLSNI